jgi:hypothetical protein
VNLFNGIKGPFISPKITANDIPPISFQKKAAKIIGMKFSCAQEPDVPPLLYTKKLIIIQSKIIIASLKKLFKICLFL